MTALVMKNDRERCLAAGMDGYLPKPIRPQELDEVLDARMEKRSSSPKARISNGHLRRAPGQRGRTSGSP